MAEGNISGNVDSDDWLINGNNSLGPAYPNPASQVANVMFSISEQMYVTIIIFDQEHEIVDYLLLNELKSAGNHVVYWVVPENVNDIFRCVIHTSTGLHGHGDILVQP